MIQLKACSVACELGVQGDQEAAEAGERVQRKLSIGLPDEPAEREADRAADRIMAMPDPALQRQPVDSEGEPRVQPTRLNVAPRRQQAQNGEEEEELLQTKAGAAGPMTTAAEAAAAAVAEGGRSLSPAERVYFEPRFGRDFSEVRVHDEPPAHAAAEAIDARAFTLSRHIAFGEREHRPATPSGLRLLAHELAHVVQQTTRCALEGWAVQRAPDAPATQPGTLPPLPPVRGFAELWADFELLQRSDPARAAALAEEIVAGMMIDDARSHGIRLLFWLMDQRRWDLAQRVLEHLSDAYLIDWATNQLVRTGLFGVQTPDPALLVRRAEAGARAGRHGPAGALFRVAYELAQMILVDLTATRRVEIERLESTIGGSEAEQVTMAEAATAGILSPTLLKYPDMSQIIGVIRDILGFYPREELAARRAGDSERARQMSGLGLLLRLDLLESHTLSQEVVTMETVAAFDPFRTRGYRLLGVTGAEEVVTPLPGTPTPEELGLFPTFTSTLGSLAGSIAGQEELSARLQGEPEVQRMFPSRPPNMNSLEDRVRVWQAMYRTYQREDTLGLGVLHRLMSLIGEYLRAFTRHTEYNIRDFGVSYLSSDFPTDLAGRAVRDCGVYALTVAYEVYRTARAARPPLPLEFRLYSVPEHVTLVIFDVDQDRHYLVNNDQISPSREGGPRDPRVLQSVANAYAATFGRAFAVTAMQDVTLGTTRQGEAAFRSQAWKRYLTTTLWGLQTEPPTGATDPRTEAQRAQDTYRRYYDALRDFDRGGRALQQRLDWLASEHARASAANQRSHLGAALPDLFNLGVRLAIIFDTYGPHARTVASGDPAHVRGVLGRGFTPETVARTLGARAYLFAHQPGRESDAHPLSRLAGALLRFHHLGGSLTPEQQSYIDWVRGVPPLNQYLQGYEGAGLPVRF